MKKLVLFSCLTVLVNFLHAQSGNKHFWETVETTASKGAIWKIWTDVDNWHLWDTGLKRASLDGLWKLNGQGNLIDTKGRKVKFKVTEFVEGESYTFRIKLFLSSFTVRRFMEQRGNVVYFTHEVRFKGLLSGIFARSLGGEFREKLPEVVQKVRQIAEDQTLTQRSQKIDMKSRSTVKSDLNLSR